MLSSLTAVLAFGLTYYATAVIQTVFHRLFGHAKRYMAVYASHTHGHHGVYRGKALLQEHWIPSERHVLWYFSIPLGILAATVYALTTPVVFITHLAAIAFSVLWHIGLHRQYHLKGSVLERYAWFRRKRALHFVHHLHVRTNYAISEYWLDRLLGTYRGWPADYDPTTFPNTTLSSPGP